MKILVIPDTQVKQGTPVDHIKAAGNYLVESRPDHVVIMGDWWDMPSLSMFNSNKEAETLRINRDLEAGNRALYWFLYPLKMLQARQRADKKKVYKPELTYIVGNHDPQVRLPRLVEKHPILEGFFDDTTTPLLEGHGFDVVPYLDIKTIGGIRFSHWFVNPHSLKGGPLGGMIDTMMKNCGFSFVQGHAQSYKVGKHYLSDGTMRIGIVAGAFYEHHEKYMGPQGNEHWRGIVQLNDVKDGGADVCELSLSYLKRNYL